MNDVLILERRTGNVDSSGFTHGNNVFEIDDGAITVSLDGNILLRRDFFSTTPLFFAVTADFFWASSSWLTIVELFLSASEVLSVNFDYINDYIKFQCPFTGDTFCKEISHLRGGEIVEISREGLVKSTFLIGDIDCRENALEHIEIPGIIEQVLAGKVFDNAVFHISAGLDSSLLALLAKRVRPERKVRVATCKTLGRGVSEELDVVKRLSESNDFDLKVYNFEEIDIFHEGKNLIDKSSLFPIAHPSHLTRFLLDRSISQNECSDIVTGRGSDELLAGYEWHSPKFDSLETHFGRICASSDSLLRELFVSDVYDTISNLSLNSYRANMASKPLALTTRLLYDRWSIGEAWDVIDGAFSGALGINYQSPFCYPEIGKKLMGVPCDIKYRNGKGKWWLREAFKDVYPSYLLDQPKRGLTFDINEYFMHYSQEEIFENIFENFEFNQKTFNKNTILSLIKMTRSKQKLFGWQLWSIFLIGVTAELLESKGVKV